MTGADGSDVADTVTADAAAAVAGDDTRDLHADGNSDENERSEVGAAVDLAAAAAAVVEGVVGERLLLNSPLNYLTV
jgi:hypothetical protein